MGLRETLEAATPETKGAIEMARYWVRNPGQICDTPYPQLCRELYSISLALTRLARLDSIGKGWRT